MLTDSQMRGVVIIAIWFGLAWLITGVIAESLQAWQRRGTPVTAWVAPQADYQTRWAARSQTTP